MQIRSAAIYMFDIRTNKSKHKSIIAYPINKRVLRPALSTTKPDVKGPVIKKRKTINEKYYAVFGFNSSPYELKIFVE